MDTGKRRLVIKEVLKAVGVKGFSLRSQTMVQGDDVCFNPKRFSILSTGSLQGVLYED
jgi:hypothetical protein